MQNTYRIKGDKVYIRIPSVNGKKALPCTEVVIDLKNFEKVQAFQGTWGQSVHQKTGELYIRGRYMENKKNIQPVLARYIAEPKHGENTRHLDGDMLNCLESNLANVDMRVQEVKGLPSIAQLNKETEEVEEEIKPVKGVSWHKGKRKWEVKPYYQGKRYNLGYWPGSQLEEANEHAEFFRTFGPGAYKEKYKGG